MSKKEGEGEGVGEGERRERQRVGGREDFSPAVLVGSVPLASHIWHTICPYLAITVNRSVSDISCIRYLMPLRYASSMFGSFDVRCANNLMFGRRATGVPMICKSVSGHPCILYLMPNIE